MVRAKIENSLAVVRRFRANHPECHDPRAEGAIEGALARVGPIDQPAPALADQPARLQL